MVKRHNPTNRTKIPLFSCSDSLCEFRKGNSSIYPLKNLAASEKLQCSAHERKSKSYVKLCMVYTELKVMIYKDPKSQSALYKCY